MTHKNNWIYVNKAVSSNFIYRVEFLVFLRYSCISSILTYTDGIYFACVRKTLIKIK